MGDWHISIRGAGAHHNQDNDRDANKMAAEFVKELRQAGHHVADACFTHGGAENIDPPTMPPGPPAE